MKNMLAWVKSNLLIVIFIAIVVVVLPASYLVSSAWGAKIRKAHEAKVAKELDSIKAAKVDYSLPSFDPSVQAVTFKAEPNQHLTQWFKERRDELASQATAIVRRAVDFNRGVGPDAQAVYRREHKPLVEGLFGDAARAPIAAALAASMGEAWTAMTPEDRVKAVKAREEEVQKELIYEMEDRLLGKRGYPNPYQRLLDGVRAGGRADAVRLVQTLRDMEARETEKITAGKRDLTDEEKQTLARALLQRRMGEYQARAREVSVYATPDVYPTSTREGSAIASGSLAAGELTPGPLFMYQWDLWAYADMLAAVRLANTGPDGRPVNVDQSVVKRIVSIRLADPDGMYGSNEPQTNLLPQDPTPATPGMIPLDPTLSVTGRGMGGWNQLYDVRRGTLTVVVASARLDEFLGAIERANFMTVTGLTLREVDPYKELEQGYYEGSDHVVEATVNIESVWLRDWTASYMPDAIKSALKFPEPTAPPAWAANAPASGAN